MNLILSLGYFIAARKREVISITKRLGFQNPPNLTLLQFFLFLFCSVTCLKAGTLADSVQKIVVSEKPLGESPQQPNQTMLRTATAVA